MCLTDFDGIIFDFDGVLVDSETLQAEAWRKVAVELGRTDVSVTLSRIAGRPDRLLVPDLFGPSAFVQHVLSRKMHYQGLLEGADGCRPIESSIRFLHAVRKTHRVAVCSNSPLCNIEKWLEAKSLRETFAAIASGTCGCAPKPSPEGYQLALKRLGVEAKKAMAIDDSAVGVAAAKASGIFTVQLVHDGCPREASADRWVTSLMELLDE